MNQPLKIKVATVLATLLGATAGTSEAYQTNNTFQPPILLAEQVKANSQTSVPPIVSAAQATKVETIKPTGMLAPIAPPSLPESVVPATMAPVDKPDSQVTPVAQWQAVSNPFNAEFPRQVSSAGVPIYSQNQSRAAAQAWEAPPFQIAPQESSYPQPPIVRTNEQPLKVPTFPASARSTAQGSDTRGDHYQDSGTMIEAPQPTYFEQPPTEAAVISTPADSGVACGCGGTGCVGCQGEISGCGSCGSNGCFDHDLITDQFNACGSISHARRYLELDVLYFDREDGDIINSNFGGLGDFESDLGWRVTLGQRFDAIRGVEMSYLGSVPLESEITRTDALGRLDALWTVSTFFTAAEVGPFFNAVSQVERKETELHTFEFNRVRWGWDVVKSFFGIRYFYINDEYSLTSTTAIPTVGFFSMETQNHLIGPHIGQEYYYDVGYRASFSVFGKLGVYANFSENDTLGASNGTVFLANSDENVTIAGSMEFGITGHYQINQRARMRAGYTVLWLGNVASVSDNFPRFLSPFTGTGTGDSDDMFFHGLSLGLEFYR